MFGVRIMAQTAWSFILLHLVTWICCNCIFSVDGISGSESSETNTRSDLDSASQPKDGSDYEFDIYDLPRPGPHEPSFPSRHHGRNGSLWYNRPMNIGLICVASSVLL